MRSRLRACLTGISFASFAQGAQRIAAFLAVAFLVPIVGVAPANAYTAATRRTVKQDIRHSNRHLFRQTTPLGVLPAGLQVLVDPIDPFDHHLVFVRQRTKDATGRARLATAGI